MPVLNEIRNAIEIGKKGRNIRYIWAKCEDCGKERWVRLLNGKPRNAICLHCACLRGAKTPRYWMIGERNHQWKGGRYKNSSGYMMTRVTHNNFFWDMAHSDGQIIEHRLIMAKYLKRCLLPWEVVHHKNGVKDDNRIENLELLPSAKYHLIDNETKAYIKRLEKENCKLRELLNQS